LNEAPCVHIAARRRGGRLAARGTRATTPRGCSAFSGAGRADAAGKLELNLEPIDLARLIDEVIGTSAQLFERSRTSLMRLRRWVPAAFTRRSGSSREQSFSTAIALEG
jgi:hypothetical protein